MSSTNKWLWIDGVPSKPDQCPLRTENIKQRALLCQPQMRWPPPGRAVGRYSFTKSATGAVPSEITRRRPVITSPERDPWDVKLSPRVLVEIRAGELPGLCAFGCASSISGGAANLPNQIRKGSGVTCIALRNSPPLDLVRVKKANATLSF